MKFRHRPLLLPSLLVFLTALPLPAQPDTDGPVELSPDLRITRLTDSSWWVTSFQDQGEEWGRIGANSLLVVSGQEAALIDTPWSAAQTHLLLDWVKQELDAKVVVVVPTHNHEDCLGGLAAAHERGAQSYGHALTAQLARERGVIAPQHTFEEMLEVTFGEARLELHHLGAGHTVDNIVVWVPSERTLFGGCLVKGAKSRTMGYIEEADLDAWPDTIAQVRERFGDAIRILPGHGAPAGEDALRRTEELIAAHRAAHPPPVEGKPFFTALSVNDAEVSAVWYGKVFNYTMVRKIDLEERGIRIRLLRSEHGFLELVEDKAAASPDERLPDLQRRFHLHGFYKSGLLVEDLEATVKRLEALEVPLRGKIVTESDGSFRSLQVEDPDGNVWQIFEELTESEP